MAKNNCLNCSNRVGSDYCTMQKNMDNAKYKNCPEHKTLPKKVRKIIETPKRHLTVLDDHEYSSTFMKFIKNGENYSIPKGDRIV